MFDDVKDPQTNQPTEDIFSGVDAAAPGGEPVKRPMVNPSPAVDNLPPAPPSVPAVPLGNNKKIIKTVIIILVILIVAAVAAIAGKMLYTKFYTVPSVDDTLTANQPALINTNANINVNQPDLTANLNANLPAANINEPAVVNAPPLDSDADGLSDTREIQLGTDPYSPDTDKDGLFDRDEVEIYKTNPLNPDTDGDGYLDGAEVKGGYDPNGTGKLLNINNTAPVQ